MGWESRRHRRIVHFGPSIHIHRICPGETRRVHCGFRHRHRRRIVRLHIREGELLIVKCKRSRRRFAFAAVPLECLRCVRFVTVFGNHTVKIHRREHRREHCQW